MGTSRGGGGVVVKKEKKRIEAANLDTFSKGGEARQSITVSRGCGQEGVHPSDAQLACGEGVAS